MNSEWNWESLVGLFIFHSFSKDANFFSTKDFPVITPPTLTQAEYLAFLDSLPVHPSCLYFATQDGNAEEVERILWMIPDLDVNWKNEGKDGVTALYKACENGNDSIVSILFAHPAIDANLKSGYGTTPFMTACLNCVRLMLKDSRVKVNERDDDGDTPLLWAAFNGRIDIIKWWIASGREKISGHKDRCHWDGKEVEKDRSGDLAGEIQE